MWSKKILAMSGKKQYKDVLTCKTTVPDATTVYADNNTGKAQLKTREDKKSTYHNLIFLKPN